MSEKWIDRINALLAKAESTDSPEEAATFTEAAQRLMLKHSIDEAMLDAQKSRPESPIEVEEFRLHHASAHSRRVIQFLVFPVVHGMGTCRMFLTRDPKVFWLVGRRDDIASNKRLIESLISQAFGQMRAWAANDPRVILMDRNENRTAKGQFLVTFGTTVGDRVRQLYQTVTSETTGSELVLASRLNRVDSFVAETYGATRTRKPTRMNGHTIGREEGRAAGLRANIGNSVDSAARRAVESSR